MRQIAVILFILLLAPVISLAQKKLPAKTDVKKDTLPPGNIVHAWKVDDFNHQDSVLIDTLWYNKHKFNPWIGNNYLTSYGTPLRHNLLNERQKTEFLFNNPFGHVLKNHQNRFFYNTKSPFTYLIYNTGGSKDSQVNLDILHTQNINEYLNFGIDADIISSKRFFEEDKSLKSHYLTFFSSYNKENLNIYFSYNTNKIEYDEIGGIESTELFEDSSDYTVTGRLNNAQTLLNTKDIKLSTELFLFGKYENVPDSLYDKNLNDSLTHSQLDTTQINNINDKQLSVLYDLGYVTNEKKYSDENPTHSFYSDYAILRDSNNTADVAYRKELTNHFRILYKDSLKYLKAGLKHEFVQYSFLKDYKIGDSTINYSRSDLKYKAYNNFILNMGIRFKFSSQLALKGYGNYHLAGFSAFDYLAGMTIHWENNHQSMYGKLEVSNDEPHFFYQTYHSNYLKWDHDLDKIQHFSSEIGYMNKKMGLNITVQPEMYNNYVYLDSELQPKQYPQSLQLLSAQIRKDFHLGEFTLNNKINFQYSSHREVLNVPEYYLYHEFKFRHIFKFKSTGGKLYSQLGFSVYYYPEYYADSYMPSLNLFYNQKQEKIGGKVILNAFLNLKIKRTAFYLKYYHLNGLWEPREYYTSPLYPMSSGMLKFGITWSFYN